MSLRTLFRNRPSSAQKQEGTTDVRRRSPALAEVVRQVTERRPVHVLDLGPSRRANFEYWKAWADQISFADLRQPLAAPGPRSLAQFEAVLDERLPAEPSFDLFLLWNLLDYLNRREVALLVERIGALAKPHALVFAMLSLEVEIPARPAEMEIDDASHLLHKVQGKGRRFGPLYSSRDLGLFFAGFEVDRSFLMQHRTVEYVLRRRT